MVIVASHKTFSSKLSIQRDSTKLWDTKNEAGSSLRTYGGYMVIAASVWSTDAIKDNWEHDNCWIIYELAFHIMKYLARLDRASWQQRLTTNSNDGIVQNARSHRVIIISLSVTWHRCWWTNSVQPSCYCLSRSFKFWWCISHSCHSHLKYLSLVFNSNVSWSTKQHVIIATSPLRPTRLDCPNTNQLIWVKLFSFSPQLRFLQRQNKANSMSLMKKKHILQYIEIGLN